MLRKNNTTKRENKLNKFVIQSLKAEWDKADKVKNKSNKNSATNFGCF